MPPFSFFLFVLHKPVPPKTCAAVREPAVNDMGFTWIAIVGTHIALRTHSDAQPISITGCNVVHIIQQLDHDGRLSVESHGKWRSVSGMPRVHDALLVLSSGAFLS